MRGLDVKSLGVLACVVVISALGLSQLGDGADGRESRTSPWHIETLSTIPDAEELRGRVDTTIKQAADSLNQLPRVSVSP